MKVSSSNGSRKLFISENRMKIVRVDRSVASIPPFRVDIPTSSESIRLCTKPTWSESDDKIELG